MFLRDGNSGVVMTSYFTRETVSRKVVAVIRGRIANSYAVDYSRGDNIWQHTRIIGDKHHMTAYFVS